MLVLTAGGLLAAGVVDGICGATVACGATVGLGAIAVADDIGGAVTGTGVKDGALETGFPDGDSGWLAFGEIALAGVLGLPCASRLPDLIGTTGFCLAVVAAGKLVIRVFVLASSNSFFF